MKPRKAKTIYGETYTPVVMQVVESDHRGPRVFRRVHDDEHVTLQDNMAFWVVFAEEKTANKRPN